MTSIFDDIVDSEPGDTISVMGRDLVVKARHIMAHGHTYYCNDGYIVEVDARDQSVTIQKH